MNQYLVPANTKKSRLFLGLFTPFDCIIGGIAIGITSIALFVVNISQTSTFEILILCLLPLLIACFLLFPVPNYHNVMQLIANMINFVFGRRRYYWKGWCVKDEVK